MLLASNVYFGHAMRVPERERSDHWWARPRYQLLALACLVAVVAALVVVLAIVGSPRKDTLPYDARYLAIQFLLLIGLGAVVTFLVDLERRTREARDQRRKFEIETVSSMLDQLDQIYAEVKRTRRLVRIDQAHPKLDEARLEERMLLANDEQEEAERLRRRVEALTPRMSGLAPLAPYVRDLDNYLSDLWSDYEKSPTTQEWLMPFIAPRYSGKSNFEKFKSPYDGARSELIRLLAVVSTRSR